MNKKVINKGYTITVVSWENDGDNYGTKSKTVDSLEEAKKIHKICKELFTSHHGKNGGVGNCMEGESTPRIINYIEDNEELFSDLKDLDYPEQYFSDLAHSLMGSSEYYDFRVCEKCDVIYSPKDVFLELIEL